ncbi:hypothetical protein GGI35DRAFT_482845 [Trichoderma velutinum]
MSTKQDNHVSSFNNLPAEILLIIWEMVIRSPRALHVVAEGFFKIRTSPALIQTTAAARAALSVSRAHRDLILRHILPNTIVLRGDELAPLNIVRYNAAKDIICVAWPSSTMLDWTCEAVSLRMRKIAVYEKLLDNISWMHKVQKLALEFEIECIYNIRSSIHRWFSGLKELYVLCPTNLVLDTDDEDEEEDNPQGAPSQETSQDVSQEVTLESFMGTGIESIAPTPKQNNNAFLYTATYTGVCEDDLYLSGRAALEWLGPRQSNNSTIQEVEEQNRNSEKLRQAGIDAKAVGILLHVIEDNEKWNDINGAWPYIGE